MMDDLGNCPFCDRANVELKEENEWRKTHFVWVFQVLCWSCGARGSRCSSAEEAIRRWNTVAKKQEGEVSGNDAIGG